MEVSACVEVSVLKATWKILEGVLPGSLLLLHAWHRTSKRDDGSNHHRPANDFAAHEIDCGVQHEQPDIHEHQLHSNLHFSSKLANELSNITAIWKLQPGVI